MTIHSVGTLPCTDRGQSLQWSLCLSQSRRAALVGNSPSVASTLEVSIVKKITPCSSLVTERTRAGCTGLCATAAALDDASLATFVWSASARAVSRGGLN